MAKKTSADNLATIESVAASMPSKYTGKTAAELGAMSEEERKTIMDALPLDKQLAMTREVRDLVEKYLVECESLKEQGLVMHDHAQLLMDRADEKVFEVLRKLQAQEDKAREQEDETDGDD